MQEWFGGHHWAAWLGLALVLGVVEAASVDFVFLMLAGGALAGMITSFVAPSLVVEVVVASVVALALLGTVRPVLRHRLLDSIPDAGLGIESYRGRPGVVVEPVDEHDGRVRFDGEVWSARTADGLRPLPVGMHVTVERVEGATLVVGPSATPQDEVMPGTS